MATVELILALILVVTLASVVARRVRAPVPLVWIAAGVAMCLVPGFSRAHIDPTVFFVLFIPPLLYADGWLMPRRDLKYALRPVLALAFGLVLVTVVVVGYVVHALIPSIPLAAAFALGAIVSPTDAVATAAMTERLPLPGRVTLILNGESLINDASGLVAFKFAVAALATGTFSLWQAGAELVLIAAGGAIVGVVVAYLAGLLHGRIANAVGVQPLVHTLVSLLTPFAAYLLAERVEVSGILAVVSAGLVSGARDGRQASTLTRQHSMEVWTMLLFVFNGLVFVLLGLSLPEAIVALGRRHAWGDLALQAFALWLLVTVIRIAWVYPATYIPPLLFPLLRKIEGRQSPRAVFIVGWAGLRGSVTMAAALSLPAVVGAGTPFPGRLEIIFLAATTILLTLLINGLTLPLLIRALGLRSDGGAERERRRAEAALAKAGAAALHAELPKLATAGETSYAQHLIEQYRSRAALFSADGPQREELARASAAQRGLVMLALEAERAELATLREREVINDHTARALQPRIDHLELYASEEATWHGH
jgi:CPA1 family monovalent cation:H+ antiporter